MNFSQLIKAAKKTADQRTKAHKRLKKVAPELLKQYCEAMQGLGYKSSTFEGQLFADQFNYDSHYEGKTVFRLRLDFSELAFEENTGEDVNLEGNIFNEYENSYIPVSEITERNGLDGEVLLRMLESLPKRLAKCIEMKNKECEKIEGFLAE